ncbi:MAG: hypothetical protein HZA91_04340 [Verrucomicrobia bacterium]|nr:hypothetical protein [Verrucomicrobiota bacterium]
MKVRFVSTASLELKEAMEFYESAREGDGREAGEAEGVAARERHKSRQSTGTGLVSALVALRRV